MSRCIFTFTANNKEDINPILLNRVTTIKVSDYEHKDKINILQNYSNIRIANRLKRKPLKFEEDVYRHMLNATTS